MNTVAMKETRVAVFSDTHGNQKVMKSALVDHGPFDMLLHLGDGVRDGQAVSQELDIPLSYVCGNEDYGVSGKYKELLRLAGWKIVCFHGDRMDLNPFQSGEMWESHYAEMRRIAEEKNASLLLFGHTHKPLLKRINNIILCNPGSPSHQYVNSAEAAFAVVTARKENMEVFLMEKGEADQWEVHASDRIDKIV